ncbi:MAG: aminopeptidase P family protein [Pseudomonadota bacterium]|nr:aminopeptidase P family protein [Pseudomonadota bacterium]
MSAARHQSFADQGGPAGVAARVAALRAALSKQGVAGFVIPRGDRHQNEYLPPDQERLLWATGFSGSAGLAIVLRDKAVLFVDGRYTVQAGEQTDGAIFERRAAGEKAAQDWLSENLKAGDALGFDPWNHTFDFVEEFSKTCERLGARLVALEENPIDALWADRPAAPLGPISYRPLRLAGESAADKLARLNFDADALLVSDPHNLAWAFNIRGADVAHTPLPLGFALIPARGRPSLFLDPRKLPAPTRERLAAVADLRQPAELEAALIAEAKAGRSVAFDKATAPFKLIDAFRAAGGKPKLAPDPLTLMKACKNAAEIAGAKAAHLRDAVALAKFLAWFDVHGAATTEIGAAMALENCRAEDETFRDVSFPTISAAGPHAALPHYRVGATSDIPIRPGLFLIDSGGQYDEGTTDITRTIAVGETTPEMRDRYTRVLKGHIAIATRVFPKGTTGAQIDAFARAALWDAGLDFDHGTGHGVGVYLSVHEGPQRIAKTGTVALQPGMIVSNEPGYYAPEKFGVRIENLVLVARRDIAGAEREMFGFETISLAPIDTRPLARELLAAAEIDWLNGYHARVRAEVGPRLEGAARDWLVAATAAI